MSLQPAKQTRVLLSIKPQYAMKIFYGEKRFEYRKAIFRNPDVRTVVVYASSPVQRVIGEFEITQVHCDHVGSLWERTQDRAGISEETYLRYFGNRDRGFAIEVGRTTLYEEPKDLKDEFGIVPPQSFAYVD